MNTDSNILKILAKELYIIHIPNIPIAQNWFRIPKSFNVIYHIHKLKKNNNNNMHNYIKDANFF